MNIGIRLHDTAPGTLPERLGFARAQGFTCAHIALSKVLPDFSMNDAPNLLNDDLGAALRQALAENDMECALLGCYLKLTTADEEQLERTRAIYRAHLRFAGKQGIRAVGTETPPAPDWKADIHSEESLQRFIQCVEPLVREAEEAGAFLAIEPVACHIVNTPERAERMLEALKSDHVRIVLDAVNLLTRDNHAQADTIIAESIRRFGDRVVLLHMKDYRVDPEAYMVKSIACGTGVMRYERLIRFARERNLPMTLEDTRPDNAEAARLFLEAVKP